jgi:hypothetical protein
VAAGVQDRGRKRGGGWPGAGILAARQYAAEKAAKPADQVQPMDFSNSDLAPQASQSRNHRSQGSWAYMIVNRADEFIRPGDDHGAGLSRDIKSYRIRGVRTDIRSGDPTPPGGLLSLGVFHPGLRRGSLYIVLTRGLGDDTGATHLDRMSGRCPCSPQVQPHLIRWSNRRIGQGLLRSLHLLGALYSFAVMSSVAGHRRPINSAIKQNG